MIEEVITFETAKLAKEKGFDLPILPYYRDETFVNPWHDVTVKAYHFMDHNRIQKYTNHLFYSAPTQSLLQRWLREKHKLHVKIQSNDIGTWTTLGTKDLISNLSLRSAFTHGSYEEALEYGLVEALKLINNEQLR